MLGLLELETKLREVVWIRLLGHSAFSWLKATSSTFTNKNLINKTLHTVLNELKSKVSKHKIGTQTQKSEGTGGSVSIDY